jgi:hypothetical protein
MKPALVEAYIDAVVAGLKALLCTDSVPVGARLRFREPE